jgi:hypothetical protein
MTWIGDRVQPGDASPGARLPGVRVTLARQLLVEQRMDAAMRRFLPDEALDLGLERRALRLGHPLQAALQRVDEELLADRKTHRQRVEECGAKRVAAVPVALERGVEIDQQAADDKRCHGKSLIRYASVPAIRECAGRVWYCQVPILLPDFT